MIIRRIKVRKDLDEEKLIKFFDRLAKKPTVYIVYNVYGTAKTMWDKIGRGAEFEEYYGFDKSFRVRPFGPMWEKMRDKPDVGTFTALRCGDRGSIALIELGWPKEE